MGMQLEEPQPQSEEPAVSPTPPPPRDGYPERCYRAAVGVFAAAFAVYLFTLAPHLMPGDTGDMVKAAATLQEAHPPGYPLYSMLGKLFTALPVGDIVYRANLMAAFLGGLAVAFVFLALVIFTRHPAASLAGAFLFAFNYLFWTYFVLAETFCLNNFCLAFLAFLALLWRERRRQEPGGRHERRMLALLAFLAGVSLGNHHTMVLTFPGLMALVAATEQREPHATWRVPALLAWLGLCGAVMWGAIGGGLPKPVLALLGLALMGVFVGLADLRALTPLRLLSLCAWFGLGLVLPYLYILAAGMVYPYHHWEETGTLKGALRLFFRVKYGPLQLAPGQGTGGTPPAQAAHYFGALLGQYLMVGFALGVLGLIKTARRDGSFLLYCGGGFLLGVIFILKANIDPTPTAYDAATLERFYQLPNFFFVLWVGFGLAAVARAVEEMRQWLRELPEEQRVRLRLPAIAFALCGLVLLALGVQSRADAALCAMLVAGGLLAALLAADLAQAASAPAQAGVEGATAGPVPQPVGAPGTPRPARPRPAPVALALLLLPGALGAANYHRANLRGNYLYPRYMMNILDSLPKGAILMAWSDTIGMGADYLFHVENVRPDMALILMGLSGSDPYKTTLRRQYPDLYWSDNMRIGSKGQEKFIAENLKKHRIFIDGLPRRVNFPVVRYGLIYEIKPQGSKPTYDEVLKTNEEIWKGYDLRQVDTSLYPANSMCYSVVVFYYLYQRFCLGSEYNNVGRWADALRHFEACRKMDPRGYVAASTPYLRQVARAKAGLGQIDEALRQLEGVRKQAPDEPETYQLLAWVCRKKGDKAQAERWAKEHERRRKLAELKKEADPLLGGGGIPISTATARTGDPRK